MIVRVIFFAYFRELFGARDREMSVPDAATVKDILETLCDTAERRNIVFDGCLKPNVVVMKNGTAIINATADDKGYFNVTIDSGNYSVAIAKTGYNQLTKNNVIVSPGKATDLRIIVLTKKVEESVIDSNAMIALVAAVIIIVALIATAILFKKRKKPAEAIEKKKDEADEKATDADEGEDSKPKEKSTDPFTTDQGTDVEKADPSEPTPKKEETLKRIKVRKK